uniref:Uncharacterized protein n=1 Tax=Meloidogyne hapla TaxID=6305 RepID=A0A1I8B9F0_MELHA
MSAEEIEKNQLIKQLEAKKAALTALTNFVIDKTGGLQPILNFISVNHDYGYLEEALRILAKVIGGKQIYAEKFIRFRGFQIISDRIDFQQLPPAEILHQIMTIFKLVSHREELANMKLNRATRLAIVCTLPQQTFYYTLVGTMENALCFLLNVFHLNERSRSSLLHSYREKAIKHFIDLSVHCFYIISHILSTETTSAASSAAPANGYDFVNIIFVEPNIDFAIDPNLKQTCITILEKCLGILAVMNKEFKNNKQLIGMDTLEKFASKKIVDNGRAIALYQLILLKLDNNECHESVLNGLHRILISGIHLPVESRGYLLAESLLKYLFNQNTPIHLKKSALNVFIQLCQSGPHFNVIVPLVRYDI